MNEPTLENLLHENAHIKAMFHELSARYDSLNQDHRMLKDAYSHCRLLLGWQPDPSCSSAEPDFKSQLQ